MKKMLRKDIRLQISTDEKAMIRASMREHTDVVIQLVDYALGQGEWPIKNYKDISANLTEAMLHGAVAYAQKLYLQSCMSRVIHFNATEDAKPYAIIHSEGFVINDGLLSFSIWTENGNHSIQSPITPEEELFFRENRPYMMRIVRGNPNGFYAQIWYLVGYHQSKWNLDGLASKIIEVSIPPKSQQELRDAIKKYFALASEEQKQMLAVDVWTEDLRELSYNARKQAHLPDTCETAVYYDVSQIYLDYLDGEEIHLLDKPCIAWRQHSTKLQKISEKKPVITLPVPTYMNWSNMNIKLSEQDGNFFAGKLIWKIRIWEQKLDHFMAEITWSENDKK